MNATKQSCVIPAKAGIYGLMFEFSRGSQDIWMRSAIDSRFRGNDDVLGCEGV